MTPLFPHITVLPLYVVFGIYLNNKYSGQKREATQAKNLSSGP
jgi:hypothetical protein